jgi:hypothetical protein
MEEQLIIVKGNVSTGMQGMQDTVLGPGGFAMMPSKQPHWFTCTAKEECLMFVSFDRPYDIVWLKGQQIAPRTPHPELRNCLQLNGFDTLINAFGESGTRRERWLANGRSGERHFSGLATDK